MQRPESALFGRTFHDLRGKVRRFAPHREVAEDEARCARYNQSLQNQRLNLSREPLAAASSEVSVVADFDRSVRFTQHIPLRAHPFVFADDFRWQFDNLLLLRLLFRSRHLLRLRRLILASLLCLLCYLFIRSAQSLLNDLLLRHGRLTFHSLRRCRSRLPLDFFPRSTCNRNRSNN